MFQRYTKKSPSLSTSTPVELTKMASAEQLLSLEKRPQLIQHLREASSLDEATFNRLCLASIHNFIANCQNLPETFNSYYSHPGGCLDYALNRAEAALSLFKRYVLLEEKDSLSEEQQLWQYALFTAALFLGIGKFQADYVIHSYDSHDHIVKTWNPLLENLIDIGSQYTYSFKKESDGDLRRRLNGLLARSLLPKAGFAWIASDIEVLTVWLALLNEDLYSAGVLGAILITADAMAIQRYLNHLFAKKQGLLDSRPYKPASTFSPETPEVSKIEKQIGVEFVIWFRNALESGLILVNKEPVFIVPGGLALNSDAFKLFVREHPQYKNWQAVQKAFLSLKLHALNPSGGIYSKFELSNLKAPLTAILITKYSVLLPEKFQLFNQNTKKSSISTPMELVNHPLLSATASGKDYPIINSKGKWVDKEERIPTQSLKHGV